MPMWKIISHSLKTAQLIISQSVEYFKFVLDCKISYLEGQKLQIYPNPASDYLFLATEAQQMSYKITDITGKIVISNQQIANHKINVSMLNNGLYFATFYSDNKTQTIKPRFCNRFFAAMKY